MSKWSFFGGIQIGLVRPPSTLSPLQLYQWQIQGRKCRRPKRNIAPLWAIAKETTCEAEQVTKGNFRGQDPEKREGSENWGTVVGDDQVVPVLRCKRRSLARMPVV